MQIDGILFYKKSAPYTSGQTENVLWTKSYMLPEIFPGVIVPSILLKRKPPDFDYQKHLEKIRKQKTEQREYRRVPKQQKSINIDKLVNDISRIYISQQQEAGIQLTPQEVLISKKLGPPPKTKNQGKGRGGGGPATKKEQNILYYGDDFSYEDYCSSSYYGDYCYYGDEVRNSTDKYYSNSYYSPSFRGEEFHPMPSAGWGYEDHSGQRKPRGRGRGALPVKPMDAYSRTHMHQLFKK